MINYPYLPDRHDYLFWTLNQLIRRNGDPLTSSKIVEAGGDPHRFQNACNFLKRDLGIMFGWRGENDPYYAIDANDKQLKHYRSLATSIQGRTDGSY